MEQAPQLGKPYIYDNGVAIVDKVDHELHLAHMHDTQTGRWCVRSWNELYPANEPPPND
ncbi:hypothetical protein [Aliagarivorans marinus]|uniref:hypothetical protein n=1 Tax=Aliagarivorans marinus TaxID=561965 RepID=UPI000407F629|nr:hypothetical protein [Aliagarivorans marinus]